MDSIYVGGFSFAVGVCDVKMDFRTTEPILDNAGQIVSVEEEVARRVTFSMPLAKDFSQKLCVAIENYEKQFGPIKTTTELADMAAATDKA